MRFCTGATAKVAWAEVLPGTAHERPRRTTGSIVDCLIEPASSLSHAGFSDDCRRWSLHPQEIRLHRLFELMVGHSSRRVFGR
jgi:hypothetical protein